MDALGAVSPPLPVVQVEGLVTSPTPDDQKPRSSPDVAAVAVHMRKVDRLEGCTSPLSAREFATLLGQLVTVLAERTFTGSIEDYLKHPDGAQKLLIILPESFTRRLQNNMDELLSLMSHKYLTRFLSDAISAVKQDADAEYTKMMLAQYMALMEQVFIQQIFTPNEQTQRMPDQDYQRVKMFEALLDLQLSIWERDHSGIDGLSVLGGKPWESSGVLASLASYHGHTYQRVAKKDGGSGGSHDQRHFLRPGRILDVFWPPWRKYCHQGEPVRVHMSRPDWLPEERAAEVDKLDALDSGFYSLSDNQYLHVGNTVDAAKFSVFLTTALQFDFQDSSSLYEFINQNHCLYVQVERLRYSPIYFTNTTAVGPLPDYVIEALEILNIENESLSSLTREQLRRRFRQLAREHHPDKTHSTCTEAFLRVSQAQDTVAQWLQGLWVDRDTQDSK